MNYCIKVLECRRRERNAPEGRRRRRRREEAKELGGNVREQESRGGLGR